MKKFIYHLIALTIVVSLLMIYIQVASASEEPYYQTSDIVNAIWIIEGGLKTDWPFGIKSVYCKDYQACKKICKNTVENNRVRYINYGYKQEKDFTTFLAKRYCPTDWETWLKNLKYFLNKDK